MADSRRQSQYDAQICLGLPTHNNNNASIAPLGLTPDPRAFHGSGPQEINQMHDLLGTFPYPIDQAQEHSIEQEPFVSHPREEEIDLSAAGHNSLPYLQGNVTQHSFGQHVDRYLQGQAAPVWNPAFAAHQPPNTPSNLLRRRQLEVPPHVTPSRQGQHSTSDEGYYTQQISQQDTRSEHSNRSINFSQMVQQRIPNQQRMRSVSQGQASDNSMESQNTPIHGRTKSNTETDVGAIPCKVEGCEVMSRTRSDFKKHIARHKMEHVCRVPHCPRIGGFATINDLNRHLSTVHKAPPKGTRIYRCFAQGCKSSEKDWPRKDNFRSHLKKTHPHENTDGLTKQAEEWWDSHQQDFTGSDDHDVPMGSAPPDTEHSQRSIGPEILFYPPPTSDAGHTQPRPVPQDQFSQRPYVLQGDQWASKPMPSNPQIVDWGNTFTRQQRVTSTGYQDNNSGFTTNRSSGQSSDGFLHSSSVTLPEQHHSHRHRAPLAGPSVPDVRTEQHAENHQSQAWYPSVPTASAMSRAASSNRHAPQLLMQNQFIGVRPQTVADFRTLGDDRRENMENFPAYQGYQQPPDNEYHGRVDELTGIGYNINDDDDMYGPGFVDEIMAQSRLQQPNQMDTERASEDDAGDVDVGHLKRFLEPYNAKADNDPAKRQLKKVLTNALLSLESTTGDASSAASKVGANTDDYIEEYVNSNKKTVFRCTWRKCNSTNREWNLRSEIKKHMKRHSKPYGCTFDNCYRQFGSKSDWKRHEHTKHIQQESWRCVLNNPRSNPTSQPCEKLFWSREHFVIHLDDVHKLTKMNNPEDFNSQITKQHINTSFQPQYWCGFHKRIFRLAKKGPDGIHERYNHIAEHIINEGLSIDDWVPAHGTLTRGQLRDKSPPKPGEPLGDDEREDGGGDDDDASPTVPTSEESTSSRDSSENSPPGNFPTAPPPSLHRQQIQQLPAQPSPGPPPMARAGQKRNASSAGLPYSTQQSQLRRANFWQCHVCEDQNLLATYAACTSMSCGHERCHMCTMLYRRSRDDQ